MTISTLKRPNAGNGTIYPVHASVKVGGEYRAACQPGVRRKTYRVHEGNPADVTCRRCLAILASIETGSRKRVDDRAAKGRVIGECCICRMPIYERNSYHVLSRGRAHQMCWPEPN